jgi:hypothetical protein
VRARARVRAKARVKARARVKAKARVRAKARARARAMAKVPGSATASDSAWDSAWHPETATRTASGWAADWGSEAGSWTATVPKAPPAARHDEGDGQSADREAARQERSTAAGPVDEIAATTGAWHSSAERTTSAAWSGVRVESMLGVITST